jgi:hypothetical protein
MAGHVRVAALKCLFVPSPEEGAADRKAKRSARKNEQIVDRAFALSSRRTVMQESDLIPLIGFYRDVGIHDRQDEDRVALVRREIDHVLDRMVDNIHELVEWAGDPRHSPESRLLAGSLALARWEASAGERQRTGISPERIKAAASGLDVRSLRDACHYCSIFDGAHELAAPRPVPLSDEDLE